MRAEINHSTANVSSVVSIIQLILLVIILPLLAYLFKALTNTIVKIAVLGSQLNGVVDDVSEIKTDMKEMKGSVNTAVRQNQ